MKTKSIFNVATLMVAFSLLCVELPIANAQSTVFTYQGRLTDGGNPASGNYDLQFYLRDAATFGNPIGSTNTLVPVAVSNGLFTVTLDFGSSSFTGAERWLEIGARTNGGGTFTTLAPRQQVTPTPYAITAENVAVGGLASGTYGNAVMFNNSANTFNGSYTGNGSGLTDVSGTLPWQIVSSPTQPTQPNTGYVVTNNSLVTITLPASPNIGDVTRISGNGAGGWKVAQNAGQYVFTANLVGNIGRVWTARGVNGLLWNSVASSADGTKLVAAPNSTLIYTSTDSGVTWTARDSSRQWIGVASSADGNKLVAIVAGGQIYTSTDSGVTWTPRDSNRSWTGVASSADGTKLVAVVNLGQIYTSTDSGVTWTPHESTRFWNRVASSADGTKLVAAPSSDQIFTSTDSGATWTPHDSSRFWRSVASSADGTKLVAAVSNGQIYTSTDSGTNWTARDSSRVWWSVASSVDGAKLVAVVNGGQIYTSADSGVTWTPRESSRSWFGVASSADGSKIVSVVSDGQIYTSAPISVSSTTSGPAGYLQGYQDTAIELQFLGNGEFLPISHEGIIQSF